MVSLTSFLILNFVIDFNGLSACGKSFYTFKKYTDHMRSHAYEKPSNKTKQDKVCFELGKLHGLIENKQFGLFHCLFCIYGSDIEGKII